ncbi:Fe-S cluster assembly protein SufD [Izhakiella capsodis]|uniref:Fe-S cluster assembly protein SufD n=1 Tax=Izhakiella capsodis TaxID=1367852 RepID=A0A1I4V1H0_9GAMM|nr:Fe-S cluster assembly protein SufD [Izhakiella capsodis]SFM94913.1 Fe-S cluster assembly protein SufD [Izhakiella capsodis]
MAGLQTRSNDNAIQQWHHLFESRSDQRSMQAQQHWQQVLRLGLPTRKHENWRYTPLDQLLSERFALPESATRLNAHDLAPLALDIDAVRLVFVDGRFDAELSDKNYGSFQVEIQQASRRREFDTPIQPELFLHLTESLAEDAAIVRLARGKRAVRPLYLLNISSGRSGVVNTIHYRHHLELEAGAEAMLIEHYVSLNNSGHFSGARFTFQVGDNARLSHYKLGFESANSYHFAHNDIRVGRDARVESHSFLLGSGLSRHNTSVQLNGENSELLLNSLVLPVDNEVCDTRSYLEHNKGYCVSRQLHKTIVRDRAKAVFNGKITVAQHALKTDGQMANNNLLLGRLAEVDTKPQLEIYADDVKCSHGATIGRIDDEQMFYLRARGIDEQAAQRMIIYAFAAELTEAISDSPLKEAVLARIALRFPGGQNEF